MTSKISAATSETSKIYRVWRSYHQVTIYIAIALLPLLAFVPIAALLTDLKKSGTISFGTIALSLALVISPLIAVWYAWYAKTDPYLLLSANGLEYYGRGITIKTSWQNTKEITSANGFPSLLLHRPSVTYLSPLLRRDLSLDRRIPLYLFEYTAHSELAHDLRQYAPHLFAKAI